MGAPEADSLKIYVNHRRNMHLVLLLLRKETNQHNWWEVCVAAWTSVSRYIAAFEPEYIWFANVPCFFFCCCYLIHLMFPTVERSMFLINWVSGHLGVICPVVIAPYF